LQLLGVINRINPQTKEMSATTFNQIRDSFGSMFTEVSGGGKADLILAHENEVLESRIDIVARPPGKELQTNSLLSGGEQTMTAGSLLFSIDHATKPLTRRSCLRIPFQSHSETPGTACRQVWRRFPVDQRRGELLRRFSNCNFCSAP